MSTQPNTSQSMAAVGELLGNLWVRELSQPQIDQLQHEDVASQLAGLGADLSELSRSDAKELLEVEYCRLLIGPAEAISPIQSITEEGRFHGEAFASSQKFYGLLGDLDPTLEDVMPDHFGRQLLFLATLMNLEGDASAADATAAFYQRHIAWIEPILERVEAKSETQFYRTLCIVTRKFLAAIDE